MRSTIGRGRQPHADEVGGEIRATQANPVIEAALKFAGTGESNEELKKAVAALQAEDAGQLKKRRFGPRRRLGG